ncbi:hypothetical protein QVD17_36991 [Tagetes erecta]|uniref:Reverse transcriptase domain-containing protein n=1 Tax=Tagetes erecta TaxID=13708 RepID=A0AAD8JTF9_TARER|nr:hypothetical protein QVD17_36991 [Tagetes erecta]
MSNSTKNSASTPVQVTNVDTQTNQNTSNEEEYEASENKSSQKRALDTPEPSNLPGKKRYKPGMTVRPGDTYRFTLPQTFSYVVSDQEPESDNQTNDQTPNANPNQEFQHILDGQNQKLELVSTRFDVLHQEVRAIREYMTATRKDILEFKKAKDAKKVVVTVGKRKMSSRHMVRRRSSRRSRRAPAETEPIPLTATEQEQKIDNIVNQRLADHMSNLVAQLSLNQNHHSNGQSSMASRTVPSLNLGTNHQGEPIIGCTYDKFMACKPKEFHGKGGAVAAMRWLEEMEAVLKLNSGN